MDKFRQFFHTIGFWFLVILFSGMFFGSYGMHYYQKTRIQESIKLGCFVFDKKIYEVKERL